MAKVRIQAGAEEDSSDSDSESDSDSGSDSEGKLPPPITMQTKYSSKLPAKGQTLAQRHHHEAGALDILKRVYEEDGFTGWYRVRCMWFCRRLRPNE